MKEREGFGLIGERLEHSHSPFLHQYFNRYPYRLIPLRVEELDRFLRQGKFEGLNVTIPYKERVIPYCRELSPAAQRIGSVNTLWRRADGSLCGDNTDIFGLEKMARQAGIAFAGRKVLVLGSGGTSRTACAAVEGAGGRAVVISRQGENNYQNLEMHRDASLLINTTPVGMYPTPGEAPVDLCRLPALEGVLDVIYNPLRTRLLLQAQELGLKCSGGLAMLVYQAAEACQRFSGEVVVEAQQRQALTLLRQRAINLVLIGMPGCGKTTLGRGAAQKLGLPLVDVDEEIESQAGKSIPALFQEVGEAGFRKRERECILRQSQTGGKVLVTGGGAVLNPENREALRQNGIVVHLTRSLSKLSLEGRPLSPNRHALERLWQDRQPLYASCADRAVSNDGTLADGVQRVVEAYYEAVCG